MEVVTSIFGGNPQRQQQQQSMSSTTQPSGSASGSVSPAPSEVVAAVVAVPGSPPLPAAQQQQQQQADESTTAPSNAAGSSDAGPSDITIAIVTNPIAPAAEGDAAEVVEQGECVICLGELDDSPSTTLICNHTFHSACVTEWLNKDGRCPTCRRQIRPVVAPPAQSHGGGFDGITNASMHSMAMLMLESRRLMMLATMEAALAVLVMSYVADLISPALMILAAAITFLGASHYLARSIGAARPVLAINALYHIYLMARIVHSQQGVPFFSEHYGPARTILVSLGCVTFMEVAALKKASAFHQRLLTAPEIELRTLRTSRRAHVGWAQRLIVLVMFILICAPVVARYVCGDGNRRSSSDVCE